MYKTVQLEPPFVVYIMRWPGPWMIPSPFPPVTKQVEVVGQEMLPAAGAGFGVVKAVQLVPSVVVITAVPWGLPPA
jgi:hypothetical protein